MAVRKKMALVTGASGGIGKAICRELAGQGYSLYLHYHANQQAISELLSELQPFGGEYIPIQADLASADGYKKLAGQIFGLDVIIHNSGAAPYGLFTDLTADELSSIIQLNVTAPFMLTKELLPKLLAQGGSIIAISSIWGQTGAACEVVYSAAKGAQIAFVKALAKELALSGIRVNAIAPGAIDTAMLADFSADDLELLKQDIPMGKLGSAQNIADAVQFLLSEKASYITGQVLAVNGGWYT